MRGEVAKSRLFARCEGEIWGAGGRQDGEAEGFWMSPADLVDKILRFINKGAF